MWQHVKNVYHLFQAYGANVVFGFPGRKLIVIGVTGTDGKTTTVNLIYHILHNAGKSASMVSTVGAMIHGKKLPTGFHVTNPAAWQLQDFIKKATMTTVKPNYIVVEVSSHGLDQYRVWGIPFAIGVVTNITPEHLDYHKTYDEYLRTKVKLLKRAEIAIINKDDSSYAKILSLLHNKPIITYGLDKTSDVNIKNFSFKTSLIGEFNKYNILAAVSVCKQLGLSDKEIQDGIKTFTTPLGRMNIVNIKDGRTVVIDYAHTANGIATALSALRKETKGKLIAIVGAEGYRDEKKRPIIGETATRIADFVIITAVDPRGLIEEINKQILAGVETAGGKVGKNVFIENDREKAIDFAINTLSKKGDTIAILGKGHEMYMNIDGKEEVKWSDYEAVENAIAKIAI